MKFLGIEMDENQFEQVQKQIADLGLIKWNDLSFIQKQEWVRECLKK